MKQSTFDMSLAAAISLGFVLAIFGLRIANPWDVSWITGDIVTSQFAWEQYRADPDHYFPIVSDRYSWPLAMPLAMFDNMPLVALLVKLVAPASAGQIQYFGPVFLIGIALQAIFAWLLLGEATRGKSGTAYRLSLLLGTLFFTAAPILLVRFVLAHMSLSLQWPLIASLWLYARSNRTGVRTTLRDFAILEFVTASINVYLMAMTLMIYCGLILKFALSRSISLKNILFFALPLLSGGLALVVSGFIDPFGGGFIPGEGYGFFSANLFSPVNPMAQYLGSSLLPELPTATAGQYEGYGYLGLGGLLLLAGCLTYARIKGDGGEGLFQPLLVVAFIAFLLALSARVTFGRYSFDIGLPQTVFDALVIFRSSGRFIWVPEYCLMFIAIASLIRLATPQRAALALGLAASLQMVDLGGPLVRMQQRFAKLNGSERFADAAFQGLGRGHDALVVLPAWQCQLWNSPFHDYPWPSFIQFSNLATDNHLRTNSFYAGRTPVAQQRYHCVDAPAALAKQPADRRTAYLLSAGSFRQLGQHIAATHFCDFAEDMFICRSDRGMTGVSQRAQDAL